MRLRMRNWRLVAVGALAFGSCFLAGFLASTQLPRLERYARVKIERVSDEKLPVRILPGKVEITFFPLGVRVSDVRVAPKDELKAILDPFTVGQARATLSLFHLLQGRLRLADVEIDGVDLSLRLPKRAPSEGPPLAGLFDAIDELPITRFALSNAKLAVESKSPRLTADLERLDLSLEKTRAGLAIDVEASSLHVRDEDGDKADRMNVEARAVLARHAVFLSGLTVSRGFSHVVANGELRGDVESLKVEDYDVKARANLRLEPLRRWFQKAFPETAEQVPPLRGDVFMQADARKPAGQKEPEIQLTIRTDGLLLDDRFMLDKVAVEGAYRAGVFEASKASLTNAAGHLDVFDAKISRAGDVTTLKARAKTEGVDLHKLLPLVGAGHGDVPVHLTASGELPSCEAQIAPKFRLACQAKATVQDVVIKGSDASARRIVAFKRMDAEGDVSFDLKQFEYKAELRTPGGKGRSSGQVAYKTGFQIAYEADALPFADVETLGELKLEGELSLKGTTEGNSEAAVFAMGAQGRDLWLEDWMLGDAKAAISYKSGLLSFKDLAGNYATSRYQGRVDVDFKKDELAVELNAPFIDAKDMIKASARKFKLPVELTGTGQAQAKVSGPFRFNALTYDLKSTLYRGAVAHEPFDQVRFDVRARKGEVETQRVELTRGPAYVRLEGVGHPNGDVDAEIRGRGLRLENLQALSASGIQLAGGLEFDMGLKGYVLGPDAELRGSLTKSSIGDQAVADSTFRLKFGKKTIEGGGALIGSAVKADFVWPLAPEAPFALNVVAQDWNFAPVFAALAGPGARKEYEARLTGSAKLSSPSGGFWNATGAIDAEKFMIRRGSLKVEAPEPLLASMRDGRMTIERFRLEGDGSSMRAADTPAAARGANAKLDAQFNGKIDLSLAALITPFFEDLRGSLSFAFNVKAGPKGGAILGSAYVDHGYLKLFDLAHPFEEIKADALFNERRLLLNSLRANFAGGRVTADGSVEFKGYKNVPLNVNAQMEKVTLNVPDKVLTRGSGRLSFTGNWFPFLMKGAYDVRDGMVTMEFASGGAVEGLKRSAFLPNAILQESASPILMDLQVSFPRGIDVKNSLVDGKAIGDLRIQGPPSKPSILGSISAEKDTKVTFRDSVIFEVLSGTATFDDPAEPNPRLYVNARTRLQTTQQDYDINLVVQARAKDPRVSLSSQPPRPEKDIISLLALGAETSATDPVATTAGAKTGLSSGTQVAGTGATVGATLLSKPLNDEIKRKTGFDVSLTSSFDDTTNGTVPKVIASRQFTPKFGVSASRSFGQEPKTDAKIRYRLSQKLSALGSWEGLDRSETGELAMKQRQDTLNKLGLDLEYKFEFK